MTTIDYYEVLGVRQNASSGEIELAYRGRRTQYHPDKYQGSDAETIRWATAKMQEVNTAYAALSDPQQRAQFDARHQTSAASTNDAGPAAEDQPTLAQVLHQCFSPFGGFSRAYFAPKIPVKKLSGALESYGQGLDPEDVLVVVDSTVFGGAREGMLLTERGIRTKGLASSPTEWKWQEIRQIEVSGSDLYINAYKMADCTMAEPKELRPLFSVVQEYLNLLRSPQEQHAQSANARPQQADSEDSPVGDSDRIQMFAIAREQLIDLCEFIAPLEQQLEQDLIDRDDAVEYFGVLEQCIQDPGTAQLTFLTLGQIAVLSRCALSYGRDPEEEVPAVLLQDDDDDSRLIAQLRMVLRAMVQARQGLRQQDRTNEFFRR